MTDISPEAVERLSCILDGRGGFVKDAVVVATLRALSSALTEALQPCENCGDAIAHAMRVDQELAQSRAETAMAYERAASMMEACANPTPAQSAQHMARQYVELIRALTTPDQTAALDNLIAEAESRIWAEAAKEVMK